jgi:hypothetical protein
MQGGMVLGPGEAAAGDHRGMATCGAGCIEETAAPVHGCYGSQVWVQGKEWAGCRMPGGEDQEGPRRSGRRMWQHCTGGDARRLGLREDL